MTAALCRQAIEAGGCVVLVPGLLPAASNADAIKTDGVARTRQLSRMLGLAAQSEISDSVWPSLESLVANCIVASHSQTCAAMVTYRADFPEVNLPEVNLPGGDHHQVLRSDPAFQQIDMNNATLGNPAELTLTDNECADLQQTLNSHFADDGIRFENRDSTRWYCHFDKLPEITTIPVSAAIGRDVAECRPSGPDARAWRSKLAEIEMLLFEHPVNNERQSRGQLPVNTLWLWGEGSAKASANDISVVTDNFYTSSFASHHGIESVLPDDIKTVASENKACLIVTDKLADLSTQQDDKKNKEMLYWFEQTSGSTLWKNLKRGCWSEVVFWCGDNRLFRLHASDKKQFWRRAWIKPQPLSALVNEEELLPPEQQGNR